MEDPPIGFTCTYVDTCAVYILSLVKFIHAGASTGALSRNTIFRLQVERIATHDVNETGCFFTLS
jgi:hypothetical protein